MKITELTYSQVVNRGNCEREALEVTVTLYEDDIPTLAFVQVKDWVHERLARQTPVPPPPRQEKG